jgi:hypothetical protein
MVHFSQKIWNESLADVPKDQRPFKCNTCDYTNHSSIQLIIHVGVAHRMAIKYHYEVLNVKDKDWNQVETFGSGGAARKLPIGTPGPGSGSASGGAVVKKQTHSHSHSNSSSQPPAQPVNTLEKCLVCGEMLLQPALLFHAAQHHFSQFLAAARVPVEAPFKCPLCPHYAEQYAAMLRHFLIHHKQMEAMTEKLKQQSSTSEKVRVSNRKHFIS